MFYTQLKTAILILFIFTVITGVLYPFFVTGIAQVFFYKQANGSIIYRAEEPIGSSLIGQAFDDPKYLWGRLSATSPFSFNAAASSGSNLGPSNPVLIEAVKARTKALKTFNRNNENSIPIDLVTASASGLDPHISLASAYYQISRIAKKRGISESVVKNIIRKNVTGRLFGLLGEPVVNVLKVNLDLDSYEK
ncbi:MAG: potassium-transporting ATPase subunit KdpC [Candidatus Omnitrophota bacterium]